MFNRNVLDNKTSLVPLFKNYINSSDMAFES